MYVSKYSQILRIDHICEAYLRRTRTAWRATQFVLRGWGHFSIVQIGRLICNILFTNISVIMPAIFKNFWSQKFCNIQIYIQIHIVYESGLCGVGSCSYRIGERVSVYRASIFVVKTLKDFVEQMSDHDDLLQFVCWTVSCVAFATDG